MDESNNVSSLKQTTFSRKLIVFFIFFLLLNYLTFTRSYSLLHMKNAANYVDHLSFDGADFTGFANLLVDGLNGAMFLLNLVMSSVINIVFILILTFAFNNVYFRTFCLEKEKLVFFIKRIIWITPFLGILISIFLNLGASVITIILTVIFIYLPLPTLVQALFFGKLKKVNKSSEILK